MGYKGPTESRSPAQRRCPVLRATSVPSASVCSLSTHHAPLPVLSAGETAVHGAGKIPPVSGSVGETDNGKTNQENIIDNTCGGRYVTMVARPHGLLRPAQGRGKGLGQGWLRSPHRATIGPAWLPVSPRRPARQRCLSSFQSQKLPSGAQLPHCSATLPASFEAPLRLSEGRGLPLVVA